MPKIYLSPSLQPFNLYAGGGNEQEWMHRIADEMEPYLRTNGIVYTRSRPGMTLGQAIRASNEAYYDLHLALHSNAAPETLVGRLRGTDAYYYAYSTRGKSAAETLAGNFKKISPDPSRVRARPTTTLVELAKTNAPAVLMELEYHDNPDGAEWIRMHTEEIARNLVEGLTLYFDIPFLPEPQPVRSGTVKTKGGNLNLRAKPSLDAAVIASMPNGAAVEVRGAWNNWYVTAWRGSVGYASRDYIMVG